MALFDVNVTDIINRTPILKSKFDDYDKLKATYLKVEKYAKITGIVYAALFLFVVYKTSKIK